MLIRKVEIENIKNYDTASYEFEAGVTAINGANGAGKTTILEAIAYCLFDSLPYRKEDFVKRGCKKGSVRVTFASAVDGREYTVYRDTANGYYVFDPITKARLVEQKNQVCGWIKEHMGVEPSTDLKTLFTSTIGVPQGTFTIDFMEQAAKRKVGFDKVLRVEEYQKAADEMRGAMKLVEAKQTQQQAEMARLEGEVAILDSLLAERAKYQANSKKLQQEIREAEGEQVVIRLELASLERLHQLIETKSSEVAKLTARHENLETSCRALSAEVQRSETARRALTAALEGFTQYNQAIAQLEELEPQALLRDKLKTTLAAKERQLFKVEAALEQIKNSLQELEAYKTLRRSLKPLIEEQGNLEQQRQELQNSLAELTVLKQRRAEDEAEILRLRNDFQGVKARLAEAEKQKDLATQVPALEALRQQVEGEYQAAQVALERLQAKKREARMLAERIGNLEGEIHTLEHELKGLADWQAKAKALPEYEQENQSFLEQIAEVRLGVAREKKILGEVKEGLCPLLSQRCLNMPEGQGLDQFFKVKLGNEQQQLRHLEGAQKVLQQKLQMAKEASHKVSALVGQQTQLLRSRQKLELESKALGKLQNEIDGIKVSEASCRALKKQLSELDQQLIPARQALAQVASVQSLQEHLERLRMAGQTKKESLAKLDERLSGDSELQEKLKLINGRLDVLADPKGRARQLDTAINRELEIKKLLAATEKQEADFQLSMQALWQELANYANLDEQILQAKERRAASARDYQIYIVNQPPAALLEQKTQELKIVEGDLQVCQQNLIEVQEQLQQALAQYDEKRLNLCREKLEEVIQKIATLSSELNSSASRIQELNQDIERLLEARQKLQALVREQQRLTHLYDLSDFIRELLKKAGPFITEAHLQSITIEANHLYREVTGNPMVSLRWDAGYEVVLEEDGHERPFLNLSGGEQMSAALSIRLALLKELSEIRIAFFDEPTTNMDEERRRNLAQQIGRIKDFNQLFVISHDDAFEGFTDRVITVGAP
ncbi:MAG: SMC family ATPase [Acidobacteria bacterium]|nr:SMC family ATPase [Acidobacteriota bacterium]